MRNYADTVPWSDDEIARLLAANELGGESAARLELPNRSTNAIHANLLRLLNSCPMGRPTRPLDVTEIRAKIAALPAEQFFTRLTRLLNRDVEPEIDRGAA